VSVPWDALACRARGLATHLLSEERLRELERAQDVRRLVRLLEPSPYAALVSPHQTAPEAVDRAVSRSVAHRVETLARWAGSDPRPRAPIFLELDAHSVRAVVRGIVGGSTPEERLISAVPTPTLGPRALGVLAGADTTGAVAATLTAWAHPLGPYLLEEGRRAQPDLFRLETALVRCLAEHAPTAAERGGRVMVEFVQETLDVQNILTAILLAGARTETEPAGLFVDGGAVITRARFLEAAAAPDRERGAEVLVRATRGTIFAAPLRERPTSTSAAAHGILRARIDRLRDGSRRDPTSALPVLLFLLELRREVRSIRRALWRTSLRRTSGS
jgi:vacuolar-type H+-ATPase subunit C/Vma6